MTDSKGATHIMKAVNRLDPLRRGATAACFALLLASGPAHAIGLLFSDIFTFGDSLSETGNYNAFGAFPFDVPTSPPYAPGRWSNGPVWVEHLADNLGFAPGYTQPSEGGGTNYAWGGARTGGQAGPPGGVNPIDLGAQIDEFIGDVGMGMADPNALYVVWAGGNDVFDPMVDLATSADNVKAALTTLSGEGAVHFLVPNLPETPLDPRFAEFNTNLAAALDMAEMTLPINLTRFDANALNQAVAFDTLFNGGAIYGLTNLFDPCFDGMSACMNPDEYAFWDAIHPTARVHEILGDAAFAAVIPLPAGVWLLLSAVGVLAARRARS